MNPSATYVMLRSMANKDLQNNHCVLKSPIRATNINCKRQYRKKLSIRSYCFFLQNINPCPWPQDKKLLIIILSLNMEDWNYLNTDISLMSSFIGTGYEAE